MGASFSCLSVVTSLKNKKSVTSYCNSEIRSIYDSTLSAKLPLPLSYHKELYRHKRDNYSRCSEDSHHPPFPRKRLSTTKRKPCSLFKASLPRLSHSTSFPLPSTRCRVRCRIFYSWDLRTSRQLTYRHRSGSEKGVGEVLLWT